MHLQSFIRLSPRITQKLKFKVKEHIRTVLPVVPKFYSKVSPFAFGLQYSLDPIGHAFYKLEAFLSTDFIPFGLDPLPQLKDPT